MFFTHHLRYKNFHIYTHEKPDSSIYGLLDDAEIRLKKSELYDANLKHRIFFCSGFREYAFFAPISRKAYACNYPLINRIFFSRSDIKKNEIYAKDRTVARSVAGTIAHEICHTLIEKEVGLWRFKRMPTWKNEGYCDFIANESSISIEDGWKQFCNNQLKNTYFKFRMMVTYLMLSEKRSFREIAGTRYEESYILEKLRLGFCH